MIKKYRKKILKERKREEKKFIKKKQAKRFSMRVKVEKIKNLQIEGKN